MIGPKEAFMSVTVAPPKTRLAITYHPEIRTLGDAPRLHGRTRGASPAFVFEGETLT
jgi:hypothetical protein